ncbi:histone deacetylase family protein [Humisphaera borealis]|uniref:Histone deacetylase n=1 Tax=Humisphaera borealis TaxID=2807512 RepID=A0A7M2X1W7_9BACT|nr:histone deacetylase [Humisphaera borealis]QOV91664.1 histone deacetylase [Humisphaera borealis]
MRADIVRTQLDHNIASTGWKPVSLTEPYGRSKTRYAGKPHGHRTTPLSHPVYNPPMSVGRSLFLRCFTSPRYFAPLPPGHVFPMRKFPDSAAKLIESGVIPHTIDPGVISDLDLLRVHTPDYVQSIRTGRYNEITARRLGLPWSPELSGRSHAATAGTLAATRAAMVDGIAANLAGGTHHAFPDRGEGFCVFNDVAVAIRALQHDEPYIQCMVVDLDAHQGNGTNAIFADDPHVFTYSVHVGKNYPSTKVPGSMDVELSRWASADEYFDRLHETLPPAVERFEPDIAFYIAGADCHEDDRFGQMKLSTADMAARDRYAIRLLRGWSIPTVVLYGGGYNKVEGMTTALHCQTVEIAARGLGSTSASAKADPTSRNT